MKNADDEANLTHAVDKNDCFLNIVGLFGLVRKDGLKVQTARPRMFHEVVDLHNLWAIEWGLHQPVVW